VTDINVLVHIFHAYNL